MQPLWNACVQALISVGIVHIDVSGFIARYQDYYDYWNEAFDVVADQYRSNRMQSSTVKCLSKTTPRKSAVAWKAAVSS